MRDDLQLVITHDLHGALVVGKGIIEGDLICGQALGFAARPSLTGPMVRAILTAIRRLRAPPSCARPRSGPKFKESGRTGRPDALKNVAAGLRCCGFTGRFV
jgi:hypothetical protein